MVVPVTAPYAPSYATYTPYLTPAEFLAEPTGVDVSQLLPQASSFAAQTAVLTRVIGRASSWADQYCRKILAATSDIQSGTYRIRNGSIAVPVNNTPLIQVTNVAVGRIAGHLANLADLSGCRIGQKVVWIPLTGISPGQYTTPDPVTAAPAGCVYADVTYVNGYAHTLTATGTTIGATSLQVKNPLGIFPGLPLTVYDGSSNGVGTEGVVVDASYTGGTTVPLAAPMANGHGAGCSVSALPGFARQAVISMTCALIKERGADAYVMPSGPGRHTVQREDLMPGASMDIELAMELLEPLRRVW